MTFDKRRQRDVGLTLAGSYLGLIVGAAVGRTSITVIAAAIACGTEYVAFRHCGNLVGFLGGIGVPTATRQLWRDACVVITVIRATHESLSTPLSTLPFTSLSAALTLICVVLSGHIVALAKGAVAVFIGRRHLLPVETRNIDLSRLALPRPPPAWAMGFSRTQILNLNFGLVPAAIAADATDSPLPVVLVGSVSTVVGLIVGAALLPGLLRTFALPSAAVILKEVGRQLARYAPTVALHQAGDPSSLYQLRMWLEPVEAAGERMVVIVRNRRTMAVLGPLSCPVLCVPNGTHLIALPLPTVRAALYPSNAGPNIHLLRESGMRHVFIGHGDSDKVASVNPFSKVYNEVWVAGPAGRDRYLRAGVGVRDDEIVEVGRPQLAGIAVGSAMPTSGVVTVLYAPTWEGWGDDPHHTSLTSMGERIVSQLLDSPVPVRIIYKPHPLTGTQSPRAAQAHRRVVALLNRQGGAAGVATGARVRLAAARARRTLGDFLGWLFVPNVSQGEGEVCDVSAGTGMDEVDAQVSTPELRGCDGVTHWVVTGPTPTLHECVNQADLLISDVSSVVADWIQSQKPYIVANPAARTEAEFRQAYPTTAAAFLLTRDCADLEKIVRLVAEGNDPMAQVRRELKYYLLGPDEPAARQRFSAEVARIVAGQQSTNWRAVTQPGSVEAFRDLASVQATPT